MTPTENPAKTLAPTARIALAAIDIDGTLLGPNGDLSEANRLAVRALAGSGAVVMLASGRSHANMLPYQRALELRTPIISAHGALVRESVAEGVLYEEMIAPEAVAELVRQARLAGAAPALYNARGVFLDQRNSLIDWDQSRNSVPHTFVADVMAEAGLGCHKFMWIAEPALIRKLAPSARAAFAGAAEPTITDPPYLEFTAPGVNKASGLAAAARHFGVARENVAAFGDGNNDASMLAWAGCGVAMAHGSEAARNAARFHAPEGNPEEALARAICGLLEAVQR